VTSEEEEIPKRRVEDVSQTEAREKEAEQDKIDKAKARQREDELARRRRQDAKPQQPRGRDVCRLTSRSRSIRRQRKQSDRNRSRGRQEPPKVYKRSRRVFEEKSQGQIPLQRGLLRRGPINSAPFDTARNLRLLDAGELPASVGQGNLMVANWLISKRCDPFELGATLTLAPFDCIVVIMSPAVAETDPIVKFFTDLADGNVDNDEKLAEVLREKAIFGLFDRVFVALHRAKIASCQFYLKSIRSRGDSDIFFGTLELIMDNSRQRMERITIGIVDVRGSDIERSDIDAMVEWIVLDRIALLTGNFPHSREFVESLAMGAKAIHCEPMFQGVKYWSRECGDWWHGSSSTYFMLFGYYRSIKLPDEGFVAIPRGWSIGQDIWESLISMDDMPSWPQNDEGSVMVPNLGSIKMKDVDFGRWCQGTLQTCLWLGTAIPSYKSQQDQQNRSRGKASKDKGRSRGKASKDKGKGKGKDKDKGKDKGKGKGKDKGKGKG
jgi:hypothetical protein